MPPRPPSSFSRPPSARPPSSFNRPPRPTPRADLPRRNADGPRMNGEINARQVRVIGADGEPLGVMSPREAMTLAENEGLDLVEIAAQADPPVCKILDYGKYRYEQQKKAADARKNQKVIEIKEIKLRPGIDDHDFDVKMRSAKSFLEEGDKVKVTMRFRGREMSHQEFAMDVFGRVREVLGPLSKIEQEPRFEGRQMIMLLASTITK